MFMAAAVRWGGMGMAILGEGSTDVRGRRKVRVRVGTEKQAR